MTIDHDRARMMASDLAVNLDESRTRAGIAVAMMIESNDLTTVLATHFAIAHALEANHDQVPARWHFGAGPMAADGTERAAESMPHHDDARESWERWHAAHADYAEAGELLALLWLGLTTEAELTAIGDQLQEIGKLIDI